MIKVEKDKDTYGYYYIPGIFQSIDGKLFELSAELEDTITKEFPGEAEASIKRGFRGRSILLRHAIQTNRYTKIFITLQVDGWYIEVAQIEGKDIKDHEKYSHWTNSTEEITNIILSIFQKIYGDL